MGIGETHVPTERRRGVAADEIDRAVGEEIGGERLGVGAVERVGGDALRVHGADARTFFIFDQFFVVAAVEHVAVFLPAEFARGRETGARVAIEVPLARVAGRVAGATEDLGVGDQVVAQREIVLDRTGVLRVAAGEECGARRRADGRGGVEAVGDGPVGGDPIEVGRIDFDPFAPDERLVGGEQRAIATERAEIMLVGLDDEEIRAGRG